MQEQDVFATFLALSYTKLSSVSFDLLDRNICITFEERVEGCMSILM